jgi:hypothetical protein
MAEFDVDDLEDTPYQMEVPLAVRQGVQSYRQSAHNVARVRNFRAFDFTHYKYRCRGNLVGFTVEPSAHNYLPSKIKLASDAGVKNAIYLSYEADHATSLRFSTDRFPAIRYFFTDNLSGCAIYVDKRNGGRYFVYHINTQTHSSRKETSRQLPSWQHSESDHRLTRMHAVAARDYPRQNDRQNSSILKKDTYLAGADALRKKGKVFGKDRRILKKDWLGGTLVMGKRGVGIDDWTFYYQTWGRLDRKGASTRLRVVGCDEF